MRSKQPGLEELADLIAQVVTLTDELATNSDDFITKAILQSLATNARSTHHRVENLIALRDFRGYKFGIIDPSTGEVRKATTDEAQRLIMEFPPVEAGNILQIMKRYKHYTEAHGQEPDTRNWKWLNDPAATL